MLKSKTARFCENFIKHYDQGIPENSGMGQVRSGPRPYWGVLQQVQVQGGYPGHAPLATLAETWQVDGWMPFLDSVPLGSP